MGPLWRRHVNEMNFRFGVTCCRKTTLDKKATLLPLTTQLQTCSGGSDGFTLSARTRNKRELMIRAVLPPGQAFLCASHWIDAQARYFSAPPSAFRSAGSSHACSSQGG